MESLEITEEEFDEWQKKNADDTWQGYYHESFQKPLKNFIRSKSLQPQIQLIEVVIDSLEKAKQDPYAIRENVVRESTNSNKEARWEEGTEVGKFAFPYNHALEDQISSLNETLEELRKQV